MVQQSKTILRYKSLSSSMNSYCYIVLEIEAPKARLCGHRYDNVGRQLGIAYWRGDMTCCTVIAAHGRKELPRLLRDIFQGVLHCSAVTVTGRHGKSMEDENNVAHSSWAVMSKGGSIKIQWSTPACSNFKGPWEGSSGGG